MNALILAGGFGTRLGKVGETIPKGLISNGHHSLFEKVINDLLTLNDVEKIAVITNARFFSQYKEFIDRHFKDKIVLLNNNVAHPDGRNGALGDILFSLDKLGWWWNDLFVLVSDTYYQFDFADEIEVFKKHKSFTTVVRKFADVTQIENRLGCAVMKGEQIIDFVEKPKKAPSPFAAIPFYIYPKTILPKLKEYKRLGGNMDAPGSFIPYLIKKSIPVFALETTAPTIDVGTVDDIVRLQKIPQNKNKTPQ